MRNFSGIHLVNRAEVEKHEKWNEWAAKIPDFELKAGWRLWIIPPSCGALVRFRINLGKVSTSVYLDVNDSLGCVGEPYWEVYPYDDGDVARVLMNDTDDLIKCIEESLASQLPDELPMLPNKLKDEQND